MKSFKYTVRDKLGIHVRPAGLLCKTAKELDSEITIKKGDVVVSATRLMALMGLGIKCGDEVEIVANGGDEETSIRVMKRFFEDNL